MRLIGHMRAPILKLELPFLHPNLPCCGEATPAASIHSQAPKTPHAAMSLHPCPATLELIPSPPVLVK